MIGDILQPTHLLFIFVVALLVLGPKRLPEVGRQLGNGLRDFRAAINGDRRERRDEVEHARTESVSAWEPTSDTADDHEFAHSASEPVPDEHRPAAAAVDAPVAEHEFAHTEQGGARVDFPAPTRSGTEASAASGADHEFAASEAETSEARTDASA